MERKEISRLVNQLKNDSTGISKLKTLNLPTVFSLLPMPLSNLSMQGKQGVALFVLRLER